MSGLLRPDVGVRCDVASEVMPLLADANRSIGLGGVVPGDDEFLVIGPPVAIECMMQSTNRARVLLTEMKLGQQDALGVRHSVWPLSKRRTRVDRDAATPVGGVDVVALEVKMEADRES